MIVYYIELEDGITVTVTTYIYIELCYPHWLHCLIIITGYYHCGDCHTAFPYRLTGFNILNPSPHCAAEPYHTYPFAIRHHCIYHYNHAKQWLNIELVSPPSTAPKLPDS